MSGKINLFDSKNWIPWLNVVLIVFVIAGLHYMFTTKGLIDKSVWMNNPVFKMVIPSFEIHAYAIIEAIQQFGGSAMESSQFWTVGLKSAAGLIIVMILAPWLLVKGYLAMEKTGESGKLIPVWYAGAAVMVLAISVTGMHISKTLIQNHNMKDMIEASRSMDELRSVMMDLAFDASELMILPSADAGEAAAPIELEQLASFGEWEKFDIAIEKQLGDSILTLTGTLRDKTLARASVSRPITMRITPKNDDLFTYVNSVDR